MSYKKWRDPWRLHAKDLGKEDEWDWINRPKINWKMVGIGVIFIILSLIEVSHAEKLKSPYTFPHNEDTELHIIKSTGHEFYKCKTSRECYELYLKLQLNDRSIQCDTKMYIKRDNGYVWRLDNEL